MLYKKPTIYNTPTIYKNAGGVYNTHGVYKDGAGGGNLKNCFFLTYFENYDEITNIDTPIIGEPWSFNLPGQNYEKTNINIFGGCTAIKNTYKNSSQQNVYKIPYPDEIKFISSEMFILCEGNQSTGNGAALSMDCTYFGCSPRGNVNSFGWFGPYMTDQHSDTTLYNGTTNPSGDFTRFGINVRHKISFLSATFDIDNKVQRFYCDGVLMMEKRNINFPSWKPQITLMQATANLSMTATGIAYFNYDKSENNGTTYPIPTQKYA